MTNFIVNTYSNTTPSNFIESSVLEFNGYVRKSAENILQMGRIIFEAKKKLGGIKSEVYIDFCNRIAFKPESSALKKLNQIGKSYEHLSLHTDQLPNNWTTLYEISRLTEETFNDMLNSGVIHQAVQGSDVKKLTTHKTRVKNTQTSVLIDESIVLNGTIDGFAFICEIPNGINDLLNDQIQYFLCNLRTQGAKIKMLPPFVNSKSSFPLEA